MSLESDHPLELYLKSRNITQIEFAERIGVTENTIGNYIKGRRLPTLPIVLKIQEETKGKVTAKEFNDFYQQKKKKVW